MAIDNIKASPGYIELRKQVLEYEVLSSWWTPWIGAECLQDIAASYFAWKVNRKFDRFVLCLMKKQAIKIKREE